MQCESLRKLGEVCKSLRNQFRPRKLAKVFLHRMQRGKAKRQAAQVMRKELAKEEPIRTNSRQVLSNAQLKFKLIQQAQNPWVPLFCEQAMPDMRRTSDFGTARVCSSVSNH